MARTFAPQRQWRDSAPLRVTGAWGQLYRQLRAQDRSGKNGSVRL